MPLNPVILGLDIVQRLEVTDPVAAVLLLAMPVPIIQWTIANVTVSPTLGIPLLAAGPLIVGTGGLIIPDTAPLTQLIASALGMTDPVGVAKMGIITAHYAEVMAEHGQVKTDLLLAYAGPAPPPSGPVAGTGGITVAQPFKFWEALELTDAPGIAKWTAFGDALKDHLELFATIAPTMTNLIGGIVSGTGAVT